MNPITKEYKSITKGKKVNWKKPENERNQALAVQIWEFFGRPKERLTIGRLKKEIYQRGYKAVEETFIQYGKMHRSKGARYFEAMLKGQTVTWK